MPTINNASKMINEVKWYNKVSCLLTNLEVIILAVGKEKIQPIIKIKIFSFKYKKDRVSITALFARPNNVNKYFAACFKSAALNIIQPVIINNKVTI